MGPSKLRLFDGSITPLKPAYLRYRILRGRSQDQLEASPGQIQDKLQDQIQDQIQEPDLRELDPRISDLRYIQ